MAIGTDGPASNNCLDMFREMFLTSALAKVREMDAECVGADEILYWQQPAVRMQALRTVTVWRWAKRRILS